MLWCKILSKKVVVFFFAGHTLNKSLIITGFTLFCFNCRILYFHRGGNTRRGAHDGRGKDAHYRGYEWLLLITFFFLSLLLSLSLYIYRSHPFLYSPSPYQRLSFLVALYCVCVWPSFTCAHISLLTFFFSEETSRGQEEKAQEPWQEQKHRYRRGGRRRRRRWRWVVLYLISYRDGGPFEIFISRHLCACVRAVLATVSTFLFCFLYILILNIFYAKRKKEKLNIFLLISLFIRSWPIWIYQWTF